MRDLMLKDVRASVPQDEPTWARIGAAAASSDLSGRAIDAICGNVRAQVQDFEYPPAYFEADAAERQRLLDELANPVGEAEILGHLAHHVRFRREAEERADQERFEREVDALVHQLNAGRAAAARAAGIAEG
jgi:hypothetical protein